jgi:hypothetical protein
MRVAVLYRSNSEHARPVQEFEREYEYRTGSVLKMYDLNTKDGWSMASLYDIVRYPAVIATTNDGQLLQAWQGESLPLINDVMYYNR